MNPQIFHVLDDALALLPEQEAELSFEYRSFDVHFPLSKIQYIYSNNHEVIIHTTNGTHAWLPFYSVTDHLMIQDFFSATVWNHVEYGLILKRWNPITLK